MFDPLKIVLNMLGFPMQLSFAGGGVTIALGVTVCTGIFCIGVGVCVGVGVGFFLHTRVIGSYSRPEQHPFDVGAFPTDEHVMMGMGVGVQ
jgi:hypothetical protein